MKNRYLILLILTLVAFAIYVYKYPYCKNKSEICKKEHIKDSTSNKKYCFDDYGIKPSTLQVKLIDDMTNGYMSHQLKRINNKNNSCSYGSMSDSRTIWFDFESLKAFLEHIEHLAKENDSSILTDNLGVRIYYANYPKDRLWEGYDDLKHPPIKYKAGNYQYRHTLIFVPTIKEDGIHYDFNPLQFNSKLHHMSDYDSIMGFTVMERTNAKNSGSLWPPDNVVIDDERSRRNNGITFPLD